MKAITHRHREALKKELEESEEDLTKKNSKNKAPKKIPQEREDVSMQQIQANSSTSPSLERINNSGENLPIRLERQAEELSEQKPKAQRGVYTARAKSDYESETNSDEEHEYSAETQSTTTRNLSQSNMSTNEVQFQNQELAQARGNSSAKREEDYAVETKILEREKSNLPFEKKKDDYVI